MQAIEMSRADHRGGARGSRLVCAEDHCQGGGCKQLELLVLHRAALSGELGAHRRGRGGGVPGAERGANERLQLFVSR